jgi:hypothetical protein
MMLGEFTKPLTDKLCNALKINRESKPYHLFQMVRTFLIVNVGMLIFRSATLKESALLFVQMFSSVNFKELLDRTLIEHFSFRDYLVVAVGVMILFVIGLLKEKGHDIRVELATKPFILRWIIYLFLIFALLVTGNAAGDMAAIYGQF